MDVDVFERERPRLIRVAYGMLGSVMEAEDVVQDTYLRWSSVDSATVRNASALLTTITTRVAIDRLRSAQRRREEYVGPWLPEPMDMHPDPSEVVAEAEALTMSALVALERLNPIERAVLLLRDCFDLDYAEIADVVDKSPSNCRQIARRARERAGDVSRSGWSDDEAATVILERYLKAVGDGDVQGLAAIFAEDVVLWADGGGKARAARHPLHGAYRVARHLVGVAPQAPAGTEIRLVRFNDTPGVMAVLDGSAIAVILFEIDQGLVTGVRAVLNPDKLAHLG
jgi:RNA polymerase sigma-70 factor (ECF subfamily)